MMIRWVLISTFTLFIISAHVESQAPNQQLSPASTAGQPNLPKPNTTQTSGSYNPEGGNPQSEEDIAASKIVDAQNTGQNTVEIGIPPKYPVKVVSVEAQAHDSQVAGCRDHPNATQICDKAVNSCFCEEHETYMYSYCRKSCGYCNPETSKYHKIWRVRAASTFSPSWIVSELQMFTDVDNNLSVSMNGTNAFASSEYPGYHAFNAFDLNVNTTWMPAGWFEHKAEEDWIAYQFPIPVKITSIRITGLPEEPSATPTAMYVEAADNDIGPYRKKWTVYRSNQVTQTSGIEDCPVLWRKYDNNGRPYCYRLVAKFYSWGDAQDFCIREQASLVSITDEEELAFILEDVKICGFVWIGLNDQKQEGAYAWADNSKSNFTNWKKGDSYDEVQRHYEDCTTMDKEGNWYMSSCVNRNFFVCKKQLVPRPVAVPSDEPSELPPFVFKYPHATKPVPADEAEDVEAPGEEEEDEEEKVKELLTTSAIQHMKEAGLQPPQTLVNSESQSDSAAIQISNMIETEENATKIEEAREKEENRKIKQTDLKDAKQGNKLDNNGTTSYDQNSNHTQKTLSGQLAPPSTVIDQGPSLEQQNKQSQVAPIVAQALGLGPAQESLVPTLPPTPGPGRAPAPTETKAVRLPKRPPPYPAPLPPGNETILGNVSQPGIPEEQAIEPDQQSDNAGVTQPADEQVVDLPKNGKQEPVGHENEMKEAHDGEEEVISDGSEDKGDEEEDSDDDDEEDQGSKDGSVKGDKPIKSAKKPSDREESSEDKPNVTPTRPGEGAPLPSDDDEDEENSNDEMGEAGEEAKEKQKSRRTKPTRKTNTPSPTPKSANDINDQDDDVHPPGNQASIKLDIKPGRRGHDITQRRREKNHQAQADGLREKWRGFKSHDRESKKSKTVEHKKFSNYKQKKATKSKRKYSRPYARKSDYYGKRQMPNYPLTSGYYRQPLVDFQYNPEVYTNGYPYSPINHEKDEDLPDWSEASFDDERRGEENRREDRRGDQRREDFV